MKLMYGENGVNKVTLIGTISIIKFTPYRDSIITETKRSYC